tara:strand:- start:1088 stop:1954 length:867 start_codon:yes stop_codon:yes gene_type:complete
MIFFRTIISLIFLLASVNLMASDQKPSILIFVLDKNENNQPIRLSVSSHLTQNGFITKDGNILLKKITNSNINNLEFIIENSDTLSQISDTELLIILKLNHQLINNKVSKIFISSQIFNTQTKNFISSWSTSRKIINYSHKCDSICKNLLITEAAILLSDQLGKSITGILNAKSKEAKNYNNISKTYNFKLFNFRQKDIIYITDIMTNEFPGFIKISNEEIYGKQSSWTYYSSSHLLKLKKWLVISLAEINFNLDRDYELIISENNFFIKKFPLFNSVGSKGNTNKFN